MHSILPAPSPNDGPLVLIAALSGRALAQAAARSRYRPLVADLFADLDTCELAEDAVRVARSLGRRLARSRPERAAAPPGCGPLRRGPGLRQRLRGEARPARRHGASLRASREPSGGRRAGEGSGPVRNALP